MSARVLNPAMMTEMSRNLGGGRTVPSRAALARVRRDLFGPVDHAAARALAERELRAQSALDTERWGFDFHLEIPKSNSRYEWELVTANDVVPEPYALRGMPYLRKHAPGTPRKREENVQPPPTPPPRTLNGMTTAVSAVNGTVNAVNAVNAAAVVVVAASTKMTMPVATGKSNKTPPPTTQREDTSPADQLVDDEDTESERTPPQRERSRVPEIGESTPSNETTSLDTSFESTRKKYSLEPTTPVLPTVNPRKQSSITHFMKSRKRSLNGSTKSVIEPPEKVARNAGQIRS
ncbi:hypothetical protein KPH14_003004 [Odynerus spinipes]|uniref:Cyclin-dependent kinase inhibitor domain-containing protein n=1 Tax=Odynerus spinipes TaxID=1348599 RepID=A0AAD9RWL0_9HYME|nr:hypothetical protein KPH14_003004 [Odynerus spinipes]